MLSRVRIARPAHVIAVLAFFVVLVSWRVATNRRNAVAAIGPDLHLDTTTILLFGDLTLKNGDLCGCGRVNDRVRAAARVGVATREIELTDEVDLAVRFHVLVSPTVLVVDAKEHLLERYEGGDDATFAEITRAAARLEQTSRDGGP